MLNISNEIKAQEQSERAQLWAAARAKGHVYHDELAPVFRALKAKVTAHFLAQYPDCPANHYTLDLKVGMKYAKICKKTPSQPGGSAYAFIDLTNGDILKPASWAAPAKHARGNIRIGTVENWFNGAMNETSVAYLQ